MELVYLWVEKYKNIEKQGFNFSPRFKCHYDGENLTIEEKEYTSIFPKNINITAIVGENGSGKSSILESIIQIQSKEHNEISGFLVFECDFNLYIIDRKKIKYDKEKIIPFNLLKFNRKYASKKSKFITLWMNALNSYAIKNSDQLQLILQMNSLFYQFNQNDIENKHYELSQEINLLEILENEYYFDSFSVTLKNISVDYKDYWKESSSEENEELLKVINSIQPRSLNNDDFKFVLVHNFYIATIRFYLKRWQNVIKIPNCNFSSLFIGFITNINNQLYITTDELLKLTQDFNFKIQELVDKEPDLSNSLNILILNNTFLLIVLKNINLDYIEKESKFYKIYKFNSNKEIKSSIDAIKHFTGLEDDWLEFNFFSIDIINKENGNKYSTLSDGERQLLNISLDLLYSLKNAKNYGTNQLIVFDEADSFLHPKWSKTLIFKLKKIIENYNNLTNSNVKLHLLFSTHSPFILSDLPKENVIFLEDGEQKYPFKDKQTFGANIHTLLSHGFFMNDGLMGEFAKNKINNVIKNLKDKEYNPSKEEKENILAIIKIIGEDFLRTKLLDMYYKKFNDDFIKEQRKKDLLEQQDKIKKELENL